MKIPYKRFYLLIIASLLVMACGSTHTKKNTPITDNQGSFIFTVKDTDFYRIEAAVDKYAYNYSVDWGDGSHDSNATEGIAHEYEKKGTYTIKINGIFPKLKRCYTVLPAPSVEISSIEQWGDIEWKDMSSMFYHCPNIAINATDIPNLKSVKNMAGMFKNVKNFNQNISNWDVSNVENMGSMFAGATSFNQPIGKWNTGKVTNMGDMFRGAKKFDQDLSHWDITSVVYRDSIAYAPGIGVFFGLERMFEGVTLSTKNYDAILQSWSQQAVHKNIHFDAGNSKYSEASIEAREKLINEYQWRIRDGGLQQ